MGTKYYDFTYIDEPGHRTRNLVPETSRFLDQIDEALHGIGTEAGVSTLESSVSNNSVTITGKDSAGSEITSTTFEIEGGGSDVNSVAPLKVDTAPTVNGDAGSFAAGPGAATTETDNVAIGANAKACGGGVTIGESAAGAWGATVVGRQANGEGQRAVAVGIESHAGGGSVAIGYQAGTGDAHEKSITIGEASKTTGDYSVTVGAFNAEGGEGTVLVAAGDAKTASAASHSVIAACNTQSGTVTVAGENNVVIGCASYNYSLEATGSQCVAIGAGAQAVSADSQVAIGERAKTDSMANAGVAIGMQATCNGAETVALGKSAIADGTNSVAVGASSYAGGSYEFAVGASGVERKITHVKLPTSSTDAATKGYVDGLAPARASLVSKFDGVTMGALPVWGSGELRSAAWAITNTTGETVTIDGLIATVASAIKDSEGNRRAVIIGTGVENAVLVSGGGINVALRDALVIPANSSVFLLIVDEVF